MAIMASSKNKRSGASTKSPRPREPSPPAPFSLEWITDEAASRYLVRSHAMRDSWRRRRREEENMQAQRQAEQEQQELEEERQTSAAVDISTLSIRAPPLVAKLGSPRVPTSPFSDRLSPSAGATTTAHYDHEPDQATCRGLAVHYSRDSDDEDVDADGDVEYEEIEGYGEPVTSPSLTLHGTSPSLEDQGTHRLSRRDAQGRREMRGHAFPWSSTHAVSSSEVEVRSSRSDIHSASTYQVEPQVESFFAQGIAAVDPFLTCPIAIGPQQEALLQWWMGPFAQSFFGRPTRHGEVHPLKEICAEDFSSAATINAVLACSALHKSLHTGEDNSLLSMHHKAEAIRLLNEQLATPPLATSDATIATVIRLMCLEDWWGSQETYDTHMKGLELMVRCRGGIQGLRSNWRTECHYLSVKLIARPRWSYPSSIYPAVDLSPPNAHHPSASRKRIRHIRALCEPFADFFSSLTSLVRRSNSVSSTRSSDSATSVLDYPYIYQILQSCHPHNTRSHHSPAASLTDLHFYLEETSSLAILLYISLVVRDSWRDPDGNRNLLRALDQTIQQNIPQWHSAIDLLFWTLLKIEIFRLGHTSRFHEVIDLMAAARLFTWPFWVHAKTKICQLLCGGEDRSVPREGDSVYGNADDLVKSVLGMKLERH